MNRKKRIAWLTTNSEPWKGAAGKKALEKLSDQMIVGIFNSVRSEMTLNTLTAKPVQIGDEQVEFARNKKGGISVKLLENEDDKDDDEEDDEEDESEEDESDDDEDDEEEVENDEDDEDDEEEEVKNKRKKKGVSTGSGGPGFPPNTPMSAKSMSIKTKKLGGKAKGMKYNSAEEWEADMPEEVQRTWNAVKRIESEAKVKLVNRLVANVVENKQKAARKLYMQRDLDSLREEVSLLPKLSKNSSGFLDDEDDNEEGHETLFVGQSTAPMRVKNKKKKAVNNEADDDEDLDSEDSDGPLVAPVYNFAADLKAGRKGDSK